MFSRRGVCHGEAAAFDGEVAFHCCAGHQRDLAVDSVNRSPDLALDDQRAALYLDVIARDTRRQDHRPYVAGRAGVGSDAKRRRLGFYGRFALRRKSVVPGGGMLLCGDRRHGNAGQKPGERKQGHQGAEQSLDLSALLIPLSLSFCDAMRSSCRRRGRGRVPEPASARPRRRAPQMCDSAHHSRPPAPY